MGDQSNPLVGYSDELPVHSVLVSAFYLGKYEVTKEPIPRFSIASARV